MLPFAALPFVFHNVVPTPSQGGGFLGAAYDPLRIEVDTTTARLPGRLVPAARRLECRANEQPPRAVGIARSDERPGRRLRDNLDRAYQLLSSEAIRQAVDITREPRAMRERYGFGRAARWPVPDRRAAASMAMPGRCAGRTCCWPAGWSRRACRSSTSMTSSSRARTGTLTSTTPASTRTTCCRWPTRRSRR